MYINKKRRIMKSIRIVIEVLCIILSVTVVGLAVYAFIGENGMRFFPFVFRTGAVINILTAIKHFMYDKHLLGFIDVLFAIVLFLIGGYTATVIAG